MKIYLIVDKYNGKLYGTQRALNKVLATYLFKQRSQHRNIRAVLYKRGQI